MNMICKYLKGLDDNALFAGAMAFGLGFTLMWLCL